MRRQPIICVLLIILFAVSSGCDYGTFKRKFVRKNEKQTTPAVYNIQEYAKPPNPEIYSRAFLYWKTWEGELLTALSSSHYPKTINMLKVKQCFDQAITNLDEMKGLLKENKAKELAGYIKTLQDLSKTVNENSPSEMELSSIRDDIETHKMNVDVRFCLSSVKNDIAPEPVTPEQK